MIEIKNRLCECFKSIFPDMKEEQIVTMSKSSYVEWDSLATVTLISLIEEEFNLKIPVEHDVDFSSFELIQDYLEEITNG
jgi:acyl carrier protein